MASRTADYRKDLKETIRSCTDCGLHKVGNGPVPFFGKPSKVMIVGEAPGRQEDEAGRPLVGRAGKLLWGELAKVGIERDKVLRANAVSCYPGRTPTDDECWACRGNLHAQVLYCDPFWILAIGNIANRSLGNKLGIGEIHGQIYEQRLVHRPDRSIKVFPTYHPAAILRDQTKLRSWREDLHAFSRLVHGKRGVRA